MKLSFNFICGQLIYYVCIAINSSFSFPFCQSLICPFTFNLLDIQNFCLCGFFNNYYILKFKLFYNINISPIVYFSQFSFLISPIIYFCYDNVYWFSSYPFLIWSTISPFSNDLVCLMDERFRALALHRWVRVSVTLWGG